MSGAHVILRRGDLLWGLPADGVRGVEPLDRGASGVRVRLTGGGDWSADEVVTLAAGLEVRRPPRVVARRLPAGVSGLALLAGRPVVVAGGGSAAP